MSAKTCFEIITIPDIEQVSTVNGQCDCACVSTFDTSTIPDVFRSQLNVNDLNSIKTLQLKSISDLYTQPLRSHYNLVFNLIDRRGRAVINASALRLLEFFREARTLEDTLSSLTDYDQEDVLDTILQFMDISLIKPLDPIVPVPLQSHSIQPEKQLVAWMHITNQCNLRCPYCYLNKTSDNMSLKLGYQSVDAIFRSAQIHHFNSVKLKFSGGEAILNFPLVKALQAYAEEKSEKLNLRLESVLLSNGVAISPKIIDFLQEHNIRLMISLDGIGDFHDQNRPFLSGRGSFQQVSKSLERLIEGGLKPEISITISNHNLPGLPDAVRYVLERDLPFSLNFYRENECSATTMDLRSTNQEIIKAMHKAFQVIQEYLPRRSLLGAILDRTNLNQPHNLACGVGQNYMVINYNGHIAKCQMEIEKPITTIYEPDPLALIQADQTGIQNIPVDEKEGCRDCTWRYWCAGGCSLLTFRATGRYDVKSPNCEIYKALFPEVLRLEGLRILKYGKSSL